MMGSHRSNRTYRRRPALALVVFALVGLIILGLSAPAAADPADSRPTLRLGSSGDAVLTLEQRLTELGYQLNTPDTNFGSDTKTAVLTLQTQAKIGRDGIVGPNTWAALDAGTQAPTTPTPTPEPTPEPAPTQPGGRATLKRGATGADVAALEQRLTELGYWIDQVDSTFGAGTHHSVVALQKAAGISRDGVVGPNTWAALDSGQRPSARNSGTLIEVDLTNQLLLVVEEGSVREIHNASTGKVSGTTPVGSWTVTRQIDGYRYAPLGTLYRPKYFYRGVAIHGYTSVPSAPASHGCVRLTYPAMDHIWSIGAAPVDSVIKVY